MADESVTYLLKHHHRPLLERQKRALSEFGAVSMKVDRNTDYSNFSRIPTSPTQHASIWFDQEPRGAPSGLLRLEKLPDDCARRLMLTWYRDPATGLMQHPQTLEHLQTMAREYFSVVESARTQRPGGGRLLCLQGQGQEPRCGEGQGLCSGTRGLDSVPWAWFQARNHHQGP